MSKRGDPRFWEAMLEAERGVDSLSHYELLGLDRGATPAQIVDAYYEVMSRSDDFGGEGDRVRQQALAQLSARFGEAYRTLTDPELRREYDAGLDRGVLRSEVPDGGPRLVDARDPKTDHARRLYDQGIALAAQGELARARAQLSVALSFEPSSPAIASALVAVAEREAPITEEFLDPDLIEPTQETSLPEVLAPPVRVRVSTWDEAAKLHEMISAGKGLFVRTTKDAAVGAEIDVAVMLPDDDPVFLRAVVRHLESAGGLGVEFLPPAEQIAHEVDRLVNRPRFVAVSTDRIDMSTLEDEVTVHDAPPASLDLLTHRDDDDA